jgi:peptidyl-tRNA hydrolase ICT1
MPIPYYRSLTVSNMIRHGGSAIRIQFISTIRHYSTRVNSLQTTPEELVAARKWLTQFNAETIPKDICELSYSRASGPGGQNVNKYADPSNRWAFSLIDIVRVNTKATLRVSLTRLLPLIPPLLHDRIKASRYHAAKSNSLIIQADDSRKQSENAQSCFARLQSLIAEAATTSIPGETSTEQRERIEIL